MRSVGTRNTGPEIVVRKLLHRLGLRFRLHRQDLPGRPDIVLPRRRTAVFVHGCFWHGHRCSKGRLPKSRPDYWIPKIAGNKRRDRRNLNSLKKLGWRPIVVWQCETRDLLSLSQRLRSEFSRLRKRTDSRDGAADRN
jgi:DNA mismatch endonuclease (patch repair protein)